LACTILAEMQIRVLISQLTEVLCPSLNAAHDEVAASVFQVCNDPVKLSNLLVLWSAIPIYYTDVIACPELVVMTAINTDIVTSSLFIT